MTHAIRIHEPGPAECMKWEEVEIGDPGPGQVRLRNHAIGVNFLDVYNRSGLYKRAEVPFTPGNEGAGEIMAVGEGVSEFNAGDRVAYADPIGSYAEERIAPADRLVRLPDDIDYKTAAAMMLKGMTAQYLLRRTFPVEKGQTILFHAAAGGVGLIAGQWANSLGATVIGTAGSTEKVELARRHGYHHVINYRDEDFVARVKEITDGSGVDVVYDSVGKDTFPGSLDCLRPLGMWVIFGQSSGSPPPLDVGTLAAKGSLFVTRPTLFTYAARREDLVAGAEALFSVVRDGTVKIEINQTYPLKEAVQAHRDLEARKTTGATVLLP